jgi:hypothetical protein
LAKTANRDFRHDLGKHVIGLKHCYISTMG